MLLKPKGELIKKTIIEQGMGVMACSKELGIDHKTVSNLVQSKKCHPKTARTFCDYFAVDIWDYFEVLDQKGRVFMPGSKLSDKSRCERGYGVIDLNAPWNYRPWLRSRDVCRGDGQRHVIPDIKYPERQIHLMSNLELDVYYMLRRNELVLELFEQYPLNLQKTVSICEEMNLIHPNDFRSGELVVMTTDFIAVIKNGNDIEFRAYAIKTKEDMKDSRVLEKLKIERTYWNRLNVSWCVITEQDI